MVLSLAVAFVGLGEPGPAAASRRTPRHARAIGAVRAAVNGSASTPVSSASPSTPTRSPRSRCSGAPADLCDGRPPDRRFTIWLIVGRASSCCCRAAVPSRLAIAAASPAPGSLPPSCPQSATVGSSDTTRPTRTDPTMIAAYPISQVETARIMPSVPNCSALAWTYGGITIDDPGCRSPRGRRSAPRRADPPPADPTEEQHPGGDPPDQTQASAWTTSRPVTAIPSMAVDGPATADELQRHQPAQQPEQTPSEADMPPCGAAPRPSRTSAGSLGRSWWRRRS